MSREPSKTWNEEAPPGGAATAFPQASGPEGYEIERKIGEGSMGVVHVAHDHALGRKVAMKVLASRLAGRPGVQQRFEAEARITGQLDHPNVVPVHGLVRTQQGEPAYTMKLVDGVTLQALVEDRARRIDASTLAASSGSFLASAAALPLSGPASGASLDDAEDLPGRLEVFTKICDGVHYAHVHGVVHRDLKPDNIMVGRHGEVYVMDWGVASVGDGADVAAATPATGAVEGTPGFFAPEQAQGESPHAKHDQYALGLVLQELVTLRDAVPGRNAVERMIANTIGDRAPMRMRDGRAPPRELAMIVARAAAMRPEDRYEDVAGLAADVRRHLAGQAVTAAPDTLFQAAARWLARHREWALVALASSVVLVVVVIAGSGVARARAQTAAKAREAELAGLVASVAGRAGTIDARLARYQGLLGEISALSAERLVNGRPTEHPVYLGADFDDPARAPADAKRSVAYAQVVSFRHPVFVAPDGSRPDERMRTLSPLGPAFQSAARRSVDGSPATVEELSRSGAPIAWISLALADGLSVSWPGHGGFSSGYDARERPWYTVAVDATGPVWGAPYVDSSGLGVLLPCSSPVRHPDSGELLGVASVKLPLDGIIGDLLAWEGARSYLLDDRGHVVADSENEGWRRGSRVLDNEALPLPLYPSEEVVAAVHAGRPVVLDRDALVVGYPLPTLGWAYVVEGPP